MKIKSFAYNSIAKVSLGHIDGTREELEGLRDTLNLLLDHSQEDKRAHSQGLSLSDNQGLTVRKISGS